MKTTFLFAKTQLLRISRDYVTLIVLFSIPLLLLLLFGAFTANTNNISLKVAVVNESNTPFSQQFTSSLKKVDVLKHDDDIKTEFEARDKVKSGDLDAMILLPESFGEIKNNMPSGNAKVYVNQSDRSTGEIVMGVMNSIVEQTNVTVTGSHPPLTVERALIEGQSERVFDNLYAMFTGMAIMMVGIFGVASVIPADKKTGMLRRLRVTPLRSSQLIIGTALAYLVVCLVSVALMTALAVFGFDMSIKGSLFDFGLFVLIASFLMIAFGVLVGGVSKNTTQSDIYGQIIFISSLAFSGLWVPRALMPEWLQGITAYLPLTPVIEGLQRIVIEGVSISTLGFQLAVMCGWIIAVTLLSIKTFRWE